MLTGAMVAMFVVGLVVGAALTVGLLVFAGLRHAAEPPTVYTE